LADRGDESLDPAPSQRDTHQSTDLDIRKLIGNRVGESVVDAERRDVWDDLGDPGQLTAPSSMVRSISRSATSFFAIRSHGSVVPSG
jgi:hypothetical protein